MAERPVVCALEVTRVFADRLVTVDDRQWMLGALKEVTAKAFGSKLEDLCKHLDNNGDNKCTTLDEARGLFFGDMMSPTEQKICGEFEMQRVDLTKLCWLRILPLFFRSKSTAPGSTVVLEGSRTDSA